MVLVIGMVGADGFSEVCRMCRAQDHSWPQTKSVSVDASHDNTTLQEPVLHGVGRFRILAVEGDGCAETANIGNGSVTTVRVLQLDLNEG